MGQFYTIMPTPLGDIILTSNGQALTGVYLPGNDQYAAAQQGEKDEKYFVEAVKQLEEYFAGTRQEFDLPLAVEGTEFQKNVWQQLAKINYAETTTYSEIAQQLNLAKASRAVGNANGRNPLCIIVPCHRVIAASGGMGGYNGGISAKKWLLNHEAKTAAGQQKQAA